MNRVTHIWLLIWKVLDNKTHTTFINQSHIRKELHLLQNKTLTRHITILKDLQLVTVERQGRKNLIKKTDKFFSTRKHYSELHDVLSRSV